MAVLLAGQAWADDCHLINYGTLPVEMVGNKPTTLVQVNGSPTRFMIDTGAFFNVMSAANASALGLKLEPAPFGLRIDGIGGSAFVQQAKVKELGILNTTLKNVSFLVGGTDVGSALLGSNLLDFADLELDFAHGRLTLLKTEHCAKTQLAYWEKDGNYNVADIEPGDNGHDRRTFINVMINGHKVRAMVDSGADATVLTRDAAERIGVNLSAPGVKAGSTAMGFGAKQVKQWTVRIDSFSVGTETIQHSQMMVIDGDIGDQTDMLLGVDFILAHHMFIAKSTGKVFFTYNGGRVFTFATPPGEDPKTGAGSGADGTGAAPLSPEAYALSGQAHLSRGEPSAALADLDKAIGLAPDHAANYVARARAHEVARQPEAALTDLDTALGLDPKNFEALLMRAELRFSRKDRVGAAADATGASALAPAGSAEARTIATLYIQLDEPAAALPMLDGWIHMHNDDAMLGSALNERCFARSLSNQMLDDALKDCRKAIKRDGEKPPYLDSLGLVEFRLGHYPESVKAYEQAVAKLPRSAWSRYVLGLAKIRSGQVDAGNADLVAARSLDSQIETRATAHGLTAAP
ncbi:hypothetical protein DVT68_17295 [Dyella solisilvae]|uniref:Peptidase A2 domain-containing protein n=1 Tax=Dyella solisilvae TaxID=1920168 RepID=A0A370K4G2_9GAMM|nr:hypothetical protein DVT68_17295 [Dyella solisilvae]